MDFISIRMYNHTKEKKRKENYCNYCIKENFEETFNFLILVSYNITHLYTLHLCTFDAVEND